MDRILYPRHDGHATPADSSTTTDAHSDMSMPSSSSHSPTMMAVFQTTLSTSLYSTRWTPTTTGTYAATCLFLILLATLFRGLLALKSWQEARWLDKELNRRYVVVQGKTPLAERLSSREELVKNDKGTLVLGENGVEERVVVVRRGDAAGAGVGHGRRPWRLSVDPVRAAVDTLVAGVGYLLMLAVMTMNVGYFLSVLGGTFLGSLLVGRFIQVGEH